MDWKTYAKLARQASAESAVLLKNNNGALPLKNGERAAVFGRIQFHYYRSGTGSGGMVHVPYETNILDALKNSGRVRVDEELERIYRDWTADHPFQKVFDEKECWTVEPWSQEEMPLSEQTVSEAARRNDTAIIIIGRTAGEEKDVTPQKGSFYLSDTEWGMLRMAGREFKNTVVVLNVSNIIDMSWAESENIDSVLYVWQGGQEGGNAAADLLLGEANPCGKLSDTILYSLQDYPAYKNYGNAEKNYYQEDIYVGYRYSETFIPEKVQFPFGFGLSYTTFAYEVSDFKQSGTSIEIRAEVRNEGMVPGKETIQVYIQKTQGKLGKPLLELLEFEKTRILGGGEKQELVFSIPVENISSYDDHGATGYKSAYVVEEGHYHFYVGTSIRDRKKAGTWSVPRTYRVRQLKEVLSPVEPMQRIKPMVENRDKETYLQVYEAVSERAYNLNQRIFENRPCDSLYTGDAGWKLSDVKNEKVTMEKFLGQLSNGELACLARGEGMRSPKVTAGTASAFGGVTDSLLYYGIPIACCADGPSGIRRDDGHQAFSVPIGTALACTFNKELVEELYCKMGEEMIENKIDILLGPGMNIHRHPLNGRNFEYFSEDPLLTGKMAAAVIRGLAKSGASGTLKHFAANNQEFARTDCNAVVSERALREIYLKGFEIALKESEPMAIMSTYGAINGIWTAGNYDLLTSVLRQEWGYEGIVMTDWEACMNEDGEMPSAANTAVMVRAQNDVYMVVQDSESNSKNDNTLEGLEKGILTRGELVRNAQNICRVLMRLPAGHTGTEGGKASGKSQ